LLAALALVSVGVLAMPPRAEPTPPQQEPSAPEAPATPQPAAEALEVVDVEECAACHEDQATLPHHAGGSVNCGSCHAGATEHAESGGEPELVFGFGDDGTSQSRAEACLTCHWTEHPGFFTGPHASSGTDCSTCHSIHQPSPKSRGNLLQTAHGIGRPMENLSASSALCQGCHEEVFSQFDLNERHRLREGILDCVSCHDPHDVNPRAQLGGFKQQMCAECHADKAGPFVFEHPVMQADGCTACHDPHGSPNRHMLTFQRTAELCLSCHVSMPGFHSRFTLDTQCTNCHASIHGSNLDPVFFK
jgi:DmsE family decaheme c-type cytochrome